MPPLHSTQLQLPLSNVKFTLNAWGLAGIFGGEEAILALILVPLRHGNRWFGWYNAPGSLEVARHFGRLAFSRYPGGARPPFSSSTRPTDLFGLDGEAGPKFTAALSGTEMRTGHLGYLVMERCKEIKEITAIGGRTTRPANIALIDLDDVDYDRIVPRVSHVDVLFACFTMITSLTTCIMCAFVRDWYSFTTIMVSILAGGFANVTIASSLKLTLKSVKHSAAGSPPGDGVLVPSVWEDIVVVIKGPEHCVQAITTGKFGLEHMGRDFQLAIAVSALLLILATLAQLFLIPKGTLFGQLMFVISLCVSWVHNFRISLSHREKLQADILFQKLGDPLTRKFHAGTRTTMATLVVLLTLHGISDPRPTAVQEILRTFLPNDTLVWMKWREKVVQQVCDKSGSHLTLNKNDEENFIQRESEHILLETLLDDARAAYDGYLRVYKS